MGGRSLTLSLCLGIKSSTRAAADGENTSGAFHHCMTEYRALSFGASVLSPVTPRMTTGFSGLTAYAMYGFQSHRGELLCETRRHLEILTHNQLGFPELALRRGRFASGERLSLRNYLSVEQTLTRANWMPASACR